MSAWTEPTPSGRYKARWRITGMKAAKSRTFDFEHEALDWAETQEAAALELGRELASQHDAARAHAGLEPEPVRRGRPRSIPTRGQANPGTVQRVSPPADGSEESSPELTRLTVGERAEAWLERQIQLNDAADYRSDVRFIRTWIAPTLGAPIGKLALAELLPETVESWIADQTRHLDAEGEPAWSNRTINGRLARLRSICIDAVNNEAATRDATAGIKKLPAKAKRPHRSLAPDEVAALLKVADPIQRVWLLLGLQAGLRWGEVYGLPASAVTRHRDGTVVIWVHQVNDTKAGRIREMSTKAAALRAGHSGDEDDLREVPCPPELADELWTLVKRVRRQRGEHALLFANEHGGRVDYHNWRRSQWIKLRKTAKLHRMTRPAPPQFHDLRHTYLTVLGQASVEGERVPLRDIMALAGHHRASTTEAYLHDSGLDRQAALVAGVFAPRVDPDPDPEPTDQPDAPNERPRLVPVASAS